MWNSESHISSPPDPELQAHLAREALLALDQLIAGQTAGEMIACARVGALLRLIVQAAEIGKRAA
jgi:hypothetical protein